MKKKFSCSNLPFFSQDLVAGNIENNTNPVTLDEPYCPQNNFHLFRPKSATFG